MSCIYWLTHIVHVYHDFICSSIEKLCIGSCKLCIGSEHVSTQEQTTPSNRISQLEFVSHFGPQSPLATVAYMDGSAHVSENTLQFTGYNVGCYGPKHPTPQLQWNLCLWSPR